MSSEKHDYYCKRRDYHRAAARSASSEKVRDLHLELAESYDKLASHVLGRAPLGLVGE